MNKRRSLQQQIEVAMVVRHLTRAEAQEWAAKWINVYAKNAFGVNIHDFLWHTFSSERYPSVNNQEAQTLYQQQIAVEIVVLANDRESGSITNSLPDNLNYIDCCVFPMSLAWTMAFTHEVGWLGPYFAKHPNYSQLAAQDVASFRANERKQKETELAKERGWL